MLPDEVFDEARGGREIELKSGKRVFRHLDGTMQIIPENCYIARGRIISMDLACYGHEEVQRRQHQKRLDGYRHRNATMPLDAAALANIKDSLSERGIDVSNIKSMEDLQRLANGSK